MKPRRPDQVMLVPLDALVTPRSGDTFTDRWWAITDDEQVIFWRGRGMRGWSPQCNPHEFAARSLVRRLWRSDIAFVPVAFLGHWDEDCGHTMGWAEAEWIETFDRSDWNDDG